MAEVILPRTGATREDLAWAAGLFEGEGCFSQNKIAPRCSLAMTDEDVVRRFHAVVGIGSIFIPTNRDPAKARFKQQYWWGTAGYPSTQYIAALLWPWLGARRRGRIAELLTEYAKRPAQNKRREVCAQGHDLTDPANLYTLKKPQGRSWRYCRRCQTERTLRCRRAKNQTD